VVRVEEQQIALDERDRQAAHGAGVGAAVELVEAVPAGDAAEERVSRIHHLAQEVGERRAYGDEDPIEHAERDRGYEREHGEGEFDAADAPDLAERCDIDQAEGGGDQDGAECGDRQDRERGLQVEDGDDKRRGCDHAGEL
jgi:hypothetical protein